jgi:hypothetical protein
MVVRARASAIGSKGAGCSAEAPSSVVSAGSKTTDPTTSAGHKVTVAATSASSLVRSQSFAVRKSSYLWQHKPPVIAAAFLLQPIGRPL